VNKVVKAKSTTALKTGEYIIGYLEGEKAERERILNILKKWEMPIIMCEDSSRLKWALESARELKLDLMKEITSTEKRND